MSICSLFSSLSSLSAKEFRFFLLFPFLKLHGGFFQQGCQVSLRGTQKAQRESHYRNPYGDEEEVIIEKGPQRLNGVAGEGDRLTKENKMFQRLLGT